MKTTKRTLAGKGLPIERHPLEPSEEVFDAVHRRALDLRGRRVLIEIDGRHLDTFHALQVVLAKSQGCMTPAEEFIQSILVSYTVRGLTPEDARRALEIFRDDFADVLEATRHTMVRYADLVPPQKPEAAPVPKRLDGKRSPRQEAA